ncbi:hypothetical protein SmJEL517_g04019 [Synchytrium microbalum]|uniref:DNA ligase n=1 Tax=Synchytrium microbalum TaxID=1806994 RepID=A0A507BTY7_9FUNG|nr:uncharacterized protein SmJEL517_g04019 [Synchytrium microbalum]TPX32980.1 hypothetical protein SmJEL517_g04019 [Synchytrium microbalum]
MSGKRKGGSSSTSNKTPTKKQKLEEGQTTLKSFLSPNKPGSIPSSPRSTVPSSPNPSTSNTNANNNVTPQTTDTKGSVAQPVSQASSVTITTKPDIKSDAVEAISQSIGVVKQESVASSSADVLISTLDELNRFKPELLPSYWKSGEPTPYRWMSEAFQHVDGNTGRLIITRVLTNMLRTIIGHRPEDVLSALYLCSNRIAPSYAGIELGIGSSVLVKAVTSVTDLNSKSLKASWDTHGDWGDVVFSARRQTQMLIKPKPLTIDGVFKTLRRIADRKGAGSVNSKTDLVRKLLIAAQGEELRYVTRTLVTNLRIGATKTTALAALARAVVMEFELKNVKWNEESAKKRFLEAEAILKECYAQCPNFDIIVPKLLDPNIGLSRIVKESKCLPGVPIMPMLGKITRDLGELFEKLEGMQFCADYKFDGQRAQIHRSEDGTVSIYSRHLENMTEKYPDIVAATQQFCSDSTGSFIMDAEVCAVGEDGQIQPFQTLTNRAKKNVSVHSISVNVCVYAFDLMYLNGVSLLQEPFRRRRDLMKSAFQVVPSRFGFVPSKEMHDIEEMQDYLKEAVEAKAEGLMVKVLDHPTVTQGRGAILASYEPDKRTDAWLKVKKDYVEGMADSFDLVPIGAWVGNGRKVNWWSPVLLAVWNPETECFDAFCKCMSGFSDAFYKEMKEKYAPGSDKVIPRPKAYYNVPESLSPDVWFEPQEVWEIRGADITSSPVYPVAAGVISERGLSLRFPRFIQTRIDKGIEDASTPEQVIAMYRKGEHKPAAKEAEVEEEEGLDDDDIKEVQWDEKD